MATCAFAYFHARGPQSRGHVATAAGREVAAVALLVGGALSLLSFISFCSADTSLNASGLSEVRNWIGPAGAYWSDLWLQGVGLSAWGWVGLTLWLGCRTMLGHAAWPRARTVAGAILLTLSVATLLEIAGRGRAQTLAPGGLVGSMCLAVLTRSFGDVGACLLATSLMLVAVALAAEGALSEVGRGAYRWVAACRPTFAMWGRDWGASMRDGARRRRRPVPQLLAPPAAARMMAGPPFGRLSGAPAAVTASVYRGEVIPLDSDVGAATSGPPAGVVAADWHDSTAGRHQRAGATPEAYLSEAAALNADADGTDWSMGEPQADASFCAPDEPGGPCPTDAPGGGPSLKPTQTAGTRGSADMDAEAEMDAAPLVTGGHVPAPCGAWDSPPHASKAYRLPPVSLLDEVAPVTSAVDPAWLQEHADKLTRALLYYGIDGYVRDIRPGPVITLYEYVPGPGIKVSKIASLADDLAMSLQAMRVRIVAPIPGKGAVGIEIPNAVRQTVYLRDIIASPAHRASGTGLPLALGKDVEGAPFVADMAKMPHLLVAGATGAGKSVSINAMIMSVLFRATPEQVRLLLVDPKMLELSAYEGIPHLLLPVVTDPKKAASALRWATEEMERRYALLSSVGARGIDGYNERIAAAGARGDVIRVPAGADDDDEPGAVCVPMPYIVVVVDELADLMMVASRDVENAIMRLAQMARASGIHLVVATQRPSVDVLTGVIKANFPTRIAFQVASRHDSRTIIDGHGAEHLLGHGDMLFSSPGVGGLKRIHGAYVGEDEIARTVAFVRAQGPPRYDTSILATEETDDQANARTQAQPRDEMYDVAVTMVAETRQASVSMIQRRLRIGYNRAARIVERMEVEGLVGPADGVRPRQVLVSAPSASPSPP